MKTSILKTSLCRQRWVYALCCLVLITPLTSLAQLKADFDVDKTAGCSPLPVSFTNKTTGASSAAQYLWDFGNGNSSTLLSPGATYRNEQSYTVTLTVKDGANTSVKKETITVYKKPTLDFTASLQKSCAPAVVRFQSTATAGDGTIANYLWDFGDGTVVQGKGTTAPEHAYSFAQKSSVSLTVTNSFGCYNSLQKDELIEVLQPLKVSFTADQSNLCSAGGLVRFSNTTTGPGTLTYSWDFGDGTTSTEKAPSHQYTKKGNFSVKLTVQSSEGCSAVKEMASYVRVAELTTGIQLPKAICKDASVTFTALNTVAADSVLWEMGDGTRYTKTGPVNHTYKKAGLFSVKQTSFWGNCRLSDTKEVTVAATPDTKGFLADYKNTCGAPVTVLFRDTTKTAVQWQWEFPQSRSAVGNEQSYVFTTNGTSNVRLTVTNAAGCKTTASKSFTIGKPAVSIKYTRPAGSTGNSGCTGLNMGFEAVSSEELSSYRWNFGDGGTSTEAKPNYTFLKPGVFAVVLHYTTKSGCSDSAVYKPVTVYSKPKIDFSGPALVCGSNPAGFQAKSDSTVRSWSWYFGDNATADTTSKNHIEHKYFSEGTYTVTLVANNNTCSDTVTKKDFVKVTPPFTYIKQVLNTCVGDRATVQFKQVTAKAESLTWNFGDGTKLQSTAPEVQHEYRQSGKYTVVLTATYGQCVATDSITAYVLKKQRPQLTAAKAELCISDSLAVTAGGLEANPYVQAQNGKKHYSFVSFEYGDGSRFEGKNRVVNDFGTTYESRLSGFNNSRENLRVLVRSEFFGCTDTSAYTPLAFRGPVADFSIRNAEVCFNTPVQFEGTATAAVKSWKWNFGDSTESVSTTSGFITHAYAKPGTYKVQLTVTDDRGCTATVQAAAKQVQINGVKAAFSLPDSIVAVRTSVTFTNRSLAGAGNIQYTWLYGSNLKSTQKNLTYAYPSTGADTVTLVAQNTQNGCADTATAMLRIENLNAMFTYTASYINSNSCPPMLVRFVNTSRNSRKAVWDFGDGSMAEGQNTPDHTYKQAGIYKVVLRTFGAANQEDSTFALITVQGPSAQLKADKFFGCLNQKVTLSAQVTNAKTYYWDYGDGTLLQTRDTFSVHHYLTAGVYAPALVMTDSLGCSVAAELPQKIVIDSLALSIKGIPDHICDSAMIQFKAGVVSVATERMNKTLEYLWTFENGATNTNAQSSHRYSGAGSHSVTLKAVSPYGCMQEVRKEFVIYKSVKGSISGSTELCAGDKAQFTASVPASNTSWKWVFHDGETSTLQQTGSKEYKQAGNYPVKLVVLHEGCADTTTASLQVHATPVLRFNKTSESVCLEKSVQLGVSGGSTYAWSPAATLSGANTANPVASPRTTTTYRVIAHNSFGCSSTDSLQMVVHRPFKLNAPADTFACAGGTVQLRTSGAFSYQWLDATRTLDKQDAANPVAAPKSATVYTVIGQDEARCFTDTAYIRVRVEKLPTVSAGADLELLTGSEVTLKTKASSDVTAWKWTPSDYLSCTTCPEPVSTPRKSMAYVVSVQNRFGCTAADTVNIKLQCTQDKVFIPNAFTPNRDGLNETFSIKGKGVQMVKSFRIFDRWGSVVFERINFTIEDHNSAWDGTRQGVQLPTGTYPFVAELQCDTGELYYKKGTVTLIR